METYSKAVEVQTLPVLSHQSTDIGDEVSACLKAKSFWGIADDHESRIVMGEKKYGQRLSSYNGRNASLDAYQELLDALSYFMQMKVEGNEYAMHYFNIVAELANSLRKEI